MKRCKSVFAGWRVLILTVCLIVPGLIETAYSQTDESTMLLIQKTPPEGGNVTPRDGIHDVSLGSEVVLTATTKPGYQFVYWVGDVADATSNRTTVYLDGPKIVIAVFERIDRELLLDNEVSTSASIGGAYTTAGDYGRQGYTGGGGKRPHKYRPPIPPPTTDIEVPVPEAGDDNDVPVPEVPEPATVLLLGLGGVTIITRRRHRNTA